MTPRKVHYWLGTGLVSPGPLVGRGSGHPTLLTFRQLLEIRTVQQLRDQLGIPLPNVRSALGWLLAHVLDDGEPVRITRGPGGRLIAETGDLAVELPSGQRALPMLERLNVDLEAARTAWRDRRLPISRHVVTDASILAGTPVVDGTRIDTAVLATFARRGQYDDAVVADVLASYPRLSEAAVVDALRFEGVRAAGPASR
jgi:uncharacterized protein (DUF433 family)